MERFVPICQNLQIFSILFFLQLLRILCSVDVVKKLMKKANCISSFVWIHVCILFAKTESNVGELYFIRNLKLLLLP